MNAWQQKIHPEFTNTCLGLCMCRCLFISLHAFIAFQEYKAMEGNDEIYILCKRGLYGKIVTL